MSLDFTPRSRRITEHLWNWHQDSAPSPALRLGMDSPAGNAPLGSGDEYLDDLQSPEVSSAVMRTRVHTGTVFALTGRCQVAPYVPCAELRSLVQRIVYQSICDQRVRLRLLSFYRACRAHGARMGCLSADVLHGHHLLVDWRRQPCCKVRADSKQG